MTDKRTSTDILLSIENKIDTMARRVQNIENLYKIQLKRMNARAEKQPAQSQHVLPPPITSEYVAANTHHEQASVINKDNFDNRPRTSKFSEMAAEHGVAVDEDGPKHLDQNIQAHRAELPPDPKGEDMVEAPVRQKSRGQRGKQKTGTKTPVSQILNREDGGPLFLANIEVMDQEGSLINQARTNTKGRWLMSLAPGSYQVHVTKRFPPDSGKESVDTLYNIDIPPSDGPMELDPLFLGG